MKFIYTFLIIILSVFLGCMAGFFPSSERYVAGRIYIKERGISAEVYTHEDDPIDGMSALWNGGKVTCKADLSSVQVGDMAELYTVEDEHLVMECIGIRKGLGWFDKPQGDVIVINQKWVYRFTRL